MSTPLFISTSPSDFHILKELVKKQSKLHKVDFLLLFKLDEASMLDLKKHNINLILNDLKLSNKKSNPELINKDLKKINNFFIDFIAEKSSTELVIILGDRYELLPIAQILYLFKKIIIHIHGGEITQGSWDDSIRHSISSYPGFILSHLIVQNKYLRMGRQKIIFLIMALLVQKM